MTAVHYSLDPITPARLYDQPEPKLKLTPRMVGAMTAVGLVYAGVGMLLNLAGIEFKIPTIYDPPPIDAVVWTPPEPTTPIVPLRSAPVKAPVESLSSPTTSTPIMASDEIRTSTPLEPFEPLNTTETEAPPTPPQPPQPPQPPIKAPPTISNPTWLSKPTAAQLGRLYPSRAVERGISGAATMECRVLATGSVTNCSIIRESPAGYGFGEAALASTRYFKLNPRTVDGQAIEGAKVQIPMGFNLAQ